MKNIDRDQAIEILVRKKLPLLTPAGRDALLSEWADEEDEEDEVSSSEIGEKEGTTDPDIEQVTRSQDEVLLTALRYRYYGVRNDYIEMELARGGIEDVCIIGEPERLYKCPCCDYQSLELKGEYDICHVCFWEDDGNDDPERYSGVNHMTLAEGRANFEQFGACTRGSLKFIDPDGKKKYTHS